MVKNPKHNILVSFSGGETSAYMINWLLKNKPEHSYKFVFANTGEENEETLVFVKQVSEYYNIDVAWVEYERLSYKEVTFETAYRSHNKEEIANKWQNHPFRKYISEFGIPNMQNKTCTRDLKEYIINRYMSANGWTKSKYDTAIGIRADEIDRLGIYYYPLIKPHVTKPLVNAFWDKMPFRLQLKGYQGNCKTCWKKSLRKVVTIARENPEKFAFFEQMEKEFDTYIKPSRLKKAKENGTKIDLPIRFFRENKSVADIMEMAKDLSIENAHDDSANTNYQISILHDGTELDISNGCSESCDAFGQAS